MLARLKFKIEALVSQMLDQLPSDVWVNANTTFLDPAMGGGQFLEHIVQRLRDHGHCNSNIRSGVFGVEANIGRVNFVGMKKLPIQTAVGGVDLDHNEVFGVKQFDVVVGNPPYTEGVGKVNIYNRFVEKALNIGDTILFVIPSAWMSTTDKNLVKLRTMIIPKLKWIKMNNTQMFAGAKVRTCNVLLTSTVDENIDIDDFEESYSINRNFFNNSEILLGGTKEKTKTLVKIARTATPLVFKKTKNHRDNYYEDGNDIKILKQLSVSGAIFVNKRCCSDFDLTDVDCHRIAVGYLPSGEELGSPYLGTINYVPPGVIIPGYYRYLVVESQKEAQNLMHYLNSDFVRWILQKTRTSQSLDGPQTRFIPKEDFYNYNYDAICKKFGFK